MPKAVVLISGGLDSTTCLALARHDGFDVVGLTFAYGQRHTCELTCACEIAKSAGLAKHIVIEIPRDVFAGSALVGDGEVPKPGTVDAIGDEIPTTYVPARNTLFLSYALAVAESVVAQDIYIGINALDYSGYPDCRPEFLEAFETMANLATKAAVEGQRLRIHAPLLQLTKAQIIQRGIELGVDYGATHSCYDPIAGFACGACDSCVLRSKGFEDAGVPDPTRYAPE